MDQITIEKKRRFMKKNIENEIRKLRSVSGHPTKFKFTNKIDQILEKYTDHIEDFKCRRIIEQVESDFETHMNKKTDFEEELKM